MFRTRAVQKIIETVNNPDQVSKVVSGSINGAMHLMPNNNGFMLQTDAYKNSY